MHREPSRCSLRGTSGHARQEQSARDAAIITCVYDAAERAALADQLTDAFLAGPWNVDLIAESGAGSLGRWPSWMTALAIRVVAVYRTPPVDHRGELFALINSFLEERRAPSGESEPSRILWRSVDRSAGARDARPKYQHGWAIAEIGSVPELAERLELSDGQLAWLADVRSLERTVSKEQLRNYRYRAIPRIGGVPRVIEAPKARLKEIQRWVLREILNPVPPHEAAHGFTRCRSAITHAQLHTHRAAVLRLDLKDFFATVPAGRVYGIFRALGYTPAVCHVLTGLTTNTVPASVWQAIANATPPVAVQPRFWLGRQLATPHLPQGAPTSPALANLAAFGLDRRLSGLASTSGLRYSRYADDLIFSGPAGYTAGATRSKRSRQRSSAQRASRSTKPKQRSKAPAAARSCAASSSMFTRTFGVTNTTDSRRSCTTLPPTAPLAKTTTEFPPSRPTFAAGSPGLNCSTQNADASSANNSPKSTGGEPLIEPARQLLPAVSLPVSRRVGLALRAAAPLAW